MKKTIITLILTIIYAIGCSAQQVAVEISPKKIHIGERITLSFNIPARGEIIADQTIKNDTLELISINQSITEQDGKQVAQFRAYFTSFVEGTHRIPSIVVIDMDTATRKQIRYYTDSVEFVVVPYPVDTTKIEPKDIKDIMSERFSISEILPLIWLLLAIVGVSLGLYFLVRYLKGKQRHIPVITAKAVPQEPADVRALQALEVLKLKRLAENGQRKLYYSEMTDILRNFLMEGFGVYAMEMTTSEIVLALQQQANDITDTENLTRLQYILSTADLVKFAKYEPDSYVDDKCLNMSKDFVVNATRKEADDVQ
ncbi:MAG: hypothetical protein LBO06_08495 [Bacteroidales bacterium]|jgi:hypothetical protein|nr:hypothetical protein [Bacteroidales bacterium]